MKIVALLLELLKSALSLFTTVRRENKKEESKERVEKETEEIKKNPTDWFNKNFSSKTKEEDKKDEDTPK